jgi:hypothetical protein
VKEAARLEREGGARLEREGAARPERADGEVVP